MCTSPQLSVQLWWRTPSEEGLQRTRSSWVCRVTKASPRVSIMLRLLAKATTRSRSVWIITLFHKRKTRSYQLLWYSVSWRITLKYVSWTKLSLKCTLWVLETLRGMWMPRKTTTKWVSWFQILVSSASRFMSHIPENPTNTRIQLVLRSIWSH